MTRYVKYDIKRCSDLIHLIDLTHNTLVSFLSYLMMNRFKTIFLNCGRSKSKVVILWSIKWQQGADGWWRGRIWLGGCCSVCASGLQVNEVWRSCCFLFLVSKTTVLNSIFFNGTTQKIILSARRLFWIEHILMPQLFYGSFLNWLFLNPWIVSSTI